MSSAVEGSTAGRAGVRSSSYRYDLDGLRGIAIAFVVIFHVFVGRVSGGVDVFLLLSGYFFLGSQLRYADRPDASLNPWWPLWRTARRLLPALVLVLASTTLIALLWVPALQRIDIANQLVASLFYVQNWELVRQGATYGAASDAVSPFQHLWSMSVQGQFYLFAIGLGFAVILIRRYRPGLSAMRLATPVLAVLTSVSFFSALLWHFIDQPLNYYSTFTRFWELGLGALCVLYAPRITLAFRVREILTGVGLVMVLTTGLIIDGAAMFPGPGALYPLIGACLIILGDGRVATFLASPLMRWLGDIAYPLYLWHWPLLIIALALFDRTEPTVILGIAVVLLSVLLADLTHRFVEKPLRQHARRPAFREARGAAAIDQLRTQAVARRRAGAAVAITVIALTLTATPEVLHRRVLDSQNTRLDPYTYPGALALSGVTYPRAEPEPDPYLLADTVSPAWAKGCMSTFDDAPDEIVNDRFDDDYCAFGDKESEIEVYLVGGSHSEQWIGPLDSLGQTHGFRVTPLVRQSCPAFVEDLDGVFGEDCAEFNGRVIERLEKVQPNLVVSNSTRPLLEKGRGIDEVPESYVTLWDFLENRNIPFLGLRDNPWFILEDGNGWLVSQCMAEEGDPGACSIDRDNFYAPVDPAHRELSARANMIVVDTSDWFCPGTICPPVIGNVYVYRDGNHISDDYALSLSPFIWNSLRQLLPL
ncbi:acyltransferase family protein [Corynebacterium pacaense]|uniref:acyltransferase family protein n=1 Tax=Corynebacterium pacaense TaxID=1816684 RepID=UPI001FEC83F9|nr:acyltransferase family protein [Corynebacterium pacaense]